MNQPPNLGIVLNPLTKNAQGILKSNYHLYYFQQDQYSLFLYYNHTHPVRLKSKFTYGYIHVFSNDKIYANEITSTYHLNSGFQWDQRFFRNVLEMFKSFKVMQKEEEQLEQEGEGLQKNNDVYQLLVSKETQETIQKYIKVTLIEEIGKDLQKQFWRQFSIFNQIKNHQIKSKQQSNSLLLQKRNQNLANLVAFQNQCEDNKKILMGRLSAILRQKINKLKQFGEDYNINLFKDGNHDGDSQQPKIMSSYQEEKIFMGSLFEPSQNFYH